jgi:hypothetical protein
MTGVGHFYRVAFANTQSLTCAAHYFQNLIAHCGIDLTAPGCAIFYNVRYVPMLYKDDIYRERYGSLMKSAYAYTWELE